MPRNKDYNVENPVTPGPRKPVPTDPNFYIPSAIPQPLIDPVDGHVLSPNETPTVPATPVPSGSGK